MSEAKKYTIQGQQFSEQEVVHEMEGKLYAPVELAYIALDSNYVCIRQAVASIVKFCDEQEKNGYEMNLQVVEKRGDTPFLMAIRVLRETPKEERDRRAKYKAAEPVLTKEQRYHHDLKVKYPGVSIMSMKHKDLK